MSSNIISVGGPIIYTHDLLSATPLTFQPASQGIEQLPGELLSKIFSFCGTADIPSLSRVNRTFTQIFNEKREVDAAQMLLEQIESCQTITSVKILKQQLKGLQRYCPNHLGESKQWTLAEVLKLMLPSLKAIDFSKGAVSSQEVKELLDAFKEVSQTASPIKGTILKYRDVNPALNTEQLNALFFRLLPDEMNSIHQAQQEGNLERESELYLGLEEKKNAKLKALKEYPQNYLAILQELFPEQQFEVLDYTYQRFGNIQYLDFGPFKIVQAHEQIEGPFLRLGALGSLLLNFCSKLRYFTAIPNSAEIELALLESINKYFLDSIAHINLRSNHSYIFPVASEFNNRNLECLSLDNLERPEALLARAEAYPHLKNVQIFAVWPNAHQILIKAVNRLAENCPRIETLELMCDYTDAEDVRSLIEALKKFKQLTKLTIIGPINKEEVESLLKTMKNLKRLDLDLPALTTAYLLGHIHILVPHLESLAFRNDAARILYFTPITTNLFDVINQLPKLKEISIDNPSSNVLERLRSTFECVQMQRNNIPLLRNLSQKLRAKDYPGREMFGELQKLSPKVIEDLYYFTWVHAGMPDIPDYGKKILEHDIGILNTITHPFVSLHGSNLLEQLARKQVEQFRAHFYQRDLDRLKKGNLAQFESLYRIPKAEIEYALWERHGKIGNGSDYLNNLAKPERDIKDLNLVLSMIEPLVSDLSRGVQSYHRARLEALRALMQDEKITQPQLLCVFRSLDKDLRDNLAYAIWEVSGKPQEEGFADRKIEADLRSLSDIVSKMIQSLPFDYLPNPEKTIAESLKEVLLHLMNDENIKEHLLKIYSALIPELQEKLKYQLWIAHNKPDEWGFGDRMIREDIRCLIPIIQNLTDQNFTL